jgi:hypothetical protein
MSDITKSGITEDQVLNKYETEFSQYCFDVLDVTHNDAYLRLMENGRFWEWLEEYHYEDWQALEIEDLKWEIKKLKAKIKELEETR